VSNGRKRRGGIREEGIIFLYCGDGEGKVKKKAQRKKGK